MEEKNCSPPAWGSNMSRRRGPGTPRNPTGGPGGHAFTTLAFGDSQDPSCGSPAAASPSHLEAGGPELLFYPVQLSVSGCTGLWGEDSSLCVSSSSALFTCPPSRFHPVPWLPGPCSEEGGGEVKDLVVGPRTPGLEADS